MAGIIKKPHIHGVFAIRGMLMTSISKRMVQPFRQWEKCDRYFCYEKTVLAAADGIVIEIKNLFEDTPIPEKEEVDCHAS